MRILISSLQVSQGASKGHLHPAIEIGLALKRRGHQVGILPLPSPFSEADEEQVIRCKFTLIEPPPLPKGLPLTPEELGNCVKMPETTWKAYHSFLIAPLATQFEEVIQIIKDFKPDIIVYDLLVYAAPLAGRLLNIPDLGFCAGLKLIAPPQFTSIYQTVYHALEPFIASFLAKYSLQAEFHQLELLSKTVQLVFTPEKFIPEINQLLPRRTILAGSLPISTTRCEKIILPVNVPMRNYAIVCFGSVLDPGNYPDIIQLIIKMSRQFNLHLIIRTQHFFCAEDITTACYLPLPQLLEKAALFIHHGGANTFSESLKLGVPQILIPLATDQPIQAELLKASRAGIAIYPHEISEESLYIAFKQLLDKSSPLHEGRILMKKLFQDNLGAITAANLIEQSIKIES